MFSLEIVLICFSASLSALMSWGNLALLHIRKVLGIQESEWHMLAF